MFCWERAVQLRRDALPALEAANVGLAVVGIGSLDAGETFASRTEFPKSMLYVDDSDESDDGRPNARASIFRGFSYRRESMAGPRDSTASDGE